MATKPIGHAAARALAPRFLAPCFAHSSLPAGTVRQPGHISLLRAVTQVHSKFPCASQTLALASSFPLLCEAHRSFHQSPGVNIRRPNRRNKADVRSKLVGVRASASQLPERSIRRIFGSHISQEEGNELLTQLQKNREDGMPDRDIVYYSEQDVEIGMSYLQKKYPMDEEAAINARIDGELDQEFRLPQTNVDYSPYRSSSYEKMKLAQQREDRQSRGKEERERTLKNKVEQLSSARTREQAAGLSREKGIQNAPRNFRDLLDPNRKRSEAPQWVKAYRQKATDTAIPSISTRDRLVPAGLFTLAIVLSSLWFAESYSPPSQQARLFPETPPAAATLVTLATINIVVFLAWRLVPPLWTVMNKYFVTLPLRPRAPQMLLAAFSHQTPSHLLLNIVPFYFVGIHLHDDIGRGPFLALVFSGAVLSSYTGLVVRVYKNLLFTSMLGLSGVVCTTIAAACVVNEGLTIEFAFLPKEWTSWLNTGVMLVCFMALELLSLRRAGIRGTASLEARGFAVDNIGHVAGYVAGCLAGVLVRKTDPNSEILERESFWYTERKSPLEHPRDTKPQAEDLKLSGKVSST